MIPELQKLYYYEIDHAHLDFDSDPVYQEKMARALAELEAQELSPALFSLLDADTAQEPDCADARGLFQKLGGGRDGGLSRGCTPFPFRRRPAIIGLNLDQTQKGANFHADH